MAKLIDLTGQKFNRLTVIERHGSNKHGQPLWLCKCDCGNQIITTTGALKSGNTKSCGCFRRESITKTNYQDLTGQKFGRLTVISRAGSTNAQKALWKCRCDCGNISFVATGSLESGRIQSCGCYGYEMRLKANTTHGGKRERLYRIWAGMKTRCYNKNAASYENYGARGISICDEWRESYENFRKWSLENGYADDLSIDRIDVNGNYEPSNCRWATRQEQSENTRANIFITINGEKKTLTEWSRIYNVPYKTVEHRFWYGCEMEHLFDPPKEPKKVECKGECHTLSEWSKITGIKRDTIKQRLRKGVPIEHLFDPVKK